MLRIIILLSMAMLFGCAEEADERAVGQGSLTIAPNAHALRVGDTFKVMHEYLDSRGELQNVDIAWSSSNPAVASIAVDGTLSAVGIGQAQISAETSTEKAGTTKSNIALFSVVANSAAPATIEITSSASTLLIGKTLQLSAKVKTVDGLEISDAVVSWQSSNENIATVSNTGLLSALTAGSINITAQVNGLSSPIFATVIRQEGQTRLANFESVAHTTRGTATIQSNEHGKLELTFSSEFKTDSGPRLEVFLSKGAKPTASDINLGPLKSIQGAQTYLVPDSISIIDYDWVVVYCTDFSVTFGNGMF